MKTLIAALFLAALAATPSHAEMASVIVAVDVSSSVPTDVANPVAGYRRIGVQNLNPSQALYAGTSISVSSIATNSNFGVVLAPATSTTAPATPTWFSLSAGQSLYLLTGSVVGTGRAVILREAK